LTTLRKLAAGALLAGLGCLAGTSVAQADPLTPLTPGENQFLDQARRLFPGSGDPDAFKSDGQLLDQGRYACFRRDSSGLVGYEVTYVSPIITQLAFVYLCPK